MMHSLKDELEFLFSGRGMPYQKVCLMVAVLTVLIFSVINSNNYIQNGSVIVIDLDNSKYSREFIDTLNSSSSIKVRAVLNVPTDPKTLFYQDRCIGVVYLPKDLEKNRYTMQAGSIGVFYDNTNSAQTADLKVALNSIVATENQKIAAPAGDIGFVLHDRELFNPAHSNANGQTLGFLLFFSSMFFVFATIGMIPRLKMEKKFARVLENGSPFDIIVRLIPYGGCLLTAIFVGLAILRVVSDLTFSGSILLFLLTQIFYIPALGGMSLLFGWTAANPGVAASRMILFIPGGFIMGGLTGPIPILSEWVQTASHFFPLVWEYRFVRDIMMRGASFMDFANVFGAFLIYLVIVVAVFCFCFYKARENFLRERQTQRELLPEEA